MAMHKKRLEELKKKYENEKGKKDTLVRQLEDAKKDVQDLKKSNEELAFQKELVAKASAQARDAGKEMVKSICTDALREINPALSVEFSEEEKYGAAFIDLSLVSKTNGEKVITDPASEDAGGLADIVSMGTFIAFNHLNTSNKAPVFLDEPTKFVSRDNAENTAKFIEKISNAADKQYFILTHEQDFLPNHSDTHYSLSKNKDGVSEVKRA